MALCRGEPPSESSVLGRVGDGDSGGGRFGGAFAGEAGEEREGERSFASRLQSAERGGSGVVFGGVPWRTLFERFDESLGSRAFISWWSFGSSYLEQGESIIETLARSRLAC